MGVTCAHGSCYEWLRTHHCCALKVKFDALDGLLKSDNNFLLSQTSEWAACYIARPSRAALDAAASWTILIGRTIVMQNSKRVAW